MAQIIPIRCRELASIISKKYIYNDFLYLLEFDCIYLLKFGKIIILYNFLIGAGFPYNNNLHLLTSISSPTQSASPTRPHWILPQQTLSPNSHSPKTFKKKNHHKSLIIAFVTKKRFNELYINNTK